MIVHQAFSFIYFLFVFDNVYKNPNFRLAAPTLPWPAVPWSRLCQLLGDCGLGGQLGMPELHHQHGQWAGQQRGGRGQSEPHCRGQAGGAARAWVWSPAQVSVITPCQHHSVSPQAVQCVLVPVVSVLLPGIQPPVSPLQQLQHPGQVSSLQCSD